MSSEQPVVTVSLADILRQMSTGRVWIERHHGERHVCPVCRDGGLMSVGLTGLTYTFEICTCGQPDYDHLVEQLWHRVCLAAGITNGTVAADPFAAHKAAHGGSKYQVRRPAKGKR